MSAEIETISCTVCAITLTERCVAFVVLSGVFREPLRCVHVACRCSVIRSWRGR